MSEVLVLDTSVAVAWYLPEAFSPAAHAWQRRMLAAEVRFAVPSLHYLEFANVLRHGVRQSRLEPDLANEIMDVHLDAPLIVADPPAARLLATALDYDCTAYDAAYVALADELACRLVTAERPSRPWVRRLGDRAVSVAADAGAHP